MSRNKKTILSAVIVLFLITVVLGARIRKPLATKRTEAATTTSRQSAALATTKHGPVQVVRFTLYDAGIYPRQARVEKGLVAVTIEDFSGGTSGLVVQRLNGNTRQSVGTVQRIQNHWRGREEIQLEPGSYELFMADRPNNRAQLVAEP